MSFTGLLSFSSSAPPPPAPAPSVDADDAMEVDLPQVQLPAGAVFENDLSHLKRHRRRDDDHEHGGNKFRRGQGESDEEENAGDHVEEEDQTLFPSAEDMARALESSHMELLMRACRQFKFHLRLLFQPAHELHEQSMRTVVEYIDANPDLGQVWSAFNWAQAHQPLQPLIMDIIALLLSVPIPLPTHRAPLFRHLLKHHTELIRSTLVRAIHPPTVIATLRVLLHATRAGLWRDILDAQLIVPFSALALMTKKSQKVSIRSTYLQYLTALLRVEDAQLRHRLVEDREFLGPMLKFMDQDAAEIVAEWLAALAIVLDDVKLTRALKSTFFNGYFIDNVRRLYNASEAYRTPTHAFLLHACTQPGRGMCHRDAGVYGSATAAGRAPQQGQQQVHVSGPANRVLANLLSKLDLTDALQVELMAGILTASPELVSVFTRAMVVSMDPRPSARWMANVNVVARIIGLPFPSLLDPSVRSTSSTTGAAAEIYPLAPPPIANVLVHICPSPPLARSSLHRGLSLTTSPIALFFTLRLVLAILEKLDLTLAALAKASEWWTDRDADAARAWQDTRHLVLVETLKLVPEVQAVIKVLFAAQSRLEAGTYELPEKLEPAARAIEEQEGVTPAMVYLCALRTLRVLASCAPSHLPAAFDAAKLLAPLPPPELCSDLLGLFMECPPQLSPHALATLLRVHAEGTFTDMSAPLLVKVLADAPVFVGGGEEEVGWWLHEFPKSGEVIVFVTNLLGEAIKGVYALVDRITQAVENVGKGEKKLPFSPMVVALAQQLASQSGTASLGPAADVYARLVLMRVLATQVDPAPMQHLLESLGITNIAQGVPADALESIAAHPVLSTNRLLQTLGLAAEASKQDLAAALDSLSQALDNTDSDAVRASQLVTIYTHPALAAALARDPEAVAEFTVRHVSPSLDSSVVDAVAKQFRSLIVADDGKEEAAVTNAHAHAIVAVYTALNLRLSLADVPTTRLSARQWLTLLPALDMVPAAVAMHLFTAPDVSEARLELMVPVLSGRYPLLRSSGEVQIGQDADSVDIEALPVECLDRVAGLEVVNAGPKKALVTILARYSPKFHARLVDIVDGSLDEELVEALVDASVALGDLPEFALKWIEGVDVDKVKGVLAKVSPTVAASTSSLRVALAVAECVGWEQVVPRPDVMPTLASAVVAFRACAEDADKLSEYFKKVAGMIVRRGDSVPAAVYAFLSKVLPKEDEEVKVEVDDAVALAKALVDIDSAAHPATATAALKVADAWSAHWIAKHTPTIVADILTQVMSAAAAARADESATPTRLVRLLSIARRLMSSAPSRMCKQDHLYTLIDMYKATVHPRDQLIYAMFNLYESQAATNLGQLLLFWGKPPTTTGLGGPRTFEESLDLIHAETMLRTVRYFPLDVDVLDVEPSVDATHSVLAEASDKNMTYDPRFFLSLAIKYLEQGNALELRTLLEKNLVGLAIAALASEYETTRRAGLAVLDEFYNLIDTSNLKGKASLVRTLDLLRQQIPSREGDDDLVRLPAVITTFIAQAVALLLRPDHDAHEPVHLALLSRPLLDMDGVPALNDMLNRASRERGWMLMFLESTMRSAKDLTTFLHRHVFDTVQLLSSAPLGTAAVHVQDALRIALHACVLTSHQDDEIASAAERAVYTTGILPCLHHVAETTTSLPTVLAIARAMAALTTRTAVHRAHVSSIARTCLSTLRALGNHPARDHAMWLNVLDAVVPLAAGEVASVRETAVWAVAAMEASEVAVDLGTDSHCADDASSGGVRERVLAAPPSAVVPTLEQLHEDQASMYHRVVLALASVDEGCWRRAVAVFGDENAWGVRRF